jgi:uncharacterized OB-fold protein
MEMSQHRPTKYADMFHLVSPGERFKVLSLDPYVAEGRLAMPYRYFPGPIATRFFLEMRDHRKMVGIRCPDCNVVYVPAASTCGRCFRQLEEWVEVGTEGVLESFTVTHYALPVHPVPSPVMYGIVKLDGADTGLVHLLNEVAPGGLRMGMRVEAVFREKRVGNILDIRYFRPSPGDGPSKGD